MTPEFARTIAGAGARTPTRSARPPDQSVPYDSSTYFCSYIPPNNFIASARETPEEHNPGCFEQDEGVEHRRLIFDVVEVVLMFFPRVLERSAIVVADLRPSGQPRFDQVTLGIIRNSLFELFDEDRAFGPRPDQAHLAANDIEQLRQFINPPFANPRAHAHRTELDDPECRVVKSDPLLQVEDRAA